MHRPSSIATIAPRACETKATHMFRKRRREVTPFEAEAQEADELVAAAAAFDSDSDSPLFDEEEEECEKYVPKRQCRQDLASMRSTVSKLEDQVRGASVSISELRNMIELLASQRRAQM